jgi:hypothetical protein
MTDNKEFAELNKRLGVMIALLLRTIPREGSSMSLREQISLLAEIGVRPKDMAEFLGRTQSYVNKELAGLRKGKGKPK